MSLQAVQSEASVRERVSPAEWETRVDLAAAHRLMAHYGVNDLTYNHLSARIRDEPDAMLIKPVDMMFDEITASSLIKYKLDGTPVINADKPLRSAGKVIHANLLSARPDIEAVFHTHTPANMAVAAMKCGLLPINQHAMRFYGNLGYHDFRGFEFDDDMMAPLRADVGAKGMNFILRNHGSLILGRTIAEAFVSHHFLEMACQGQIGAMAGGGELVIPDPETCAYASRQINGGDPMLAGGKDWPACLRLLDRLYPDYRD